MHMEGEILQDNVDEGGRSVMGFDLSCFEGFDNVDGWINTSSLGETARRR